MRTGRRRPLAITVAAALALSAAWATGATTASAAPTPSSVTAEVSASPYTGVTAQNDTFVDATVHGSGTPGGTLAFSTPYGPVAGCTAVPIDLSGYGSCFTVRWAHPGAGSVTVTYSGDPGHASSSVVVPVTVNPAVPAIFFGPQVEVTWPTVVTLADLGLHARMSQGGPDIPGTFTTNPSLPSRLHVGFAEIDVVFHPADTAEYQSASDYTYAWIHPGPQTLAFRPLGPVTTATRGFTLVAGTDAVAGHEQVATFTSSTPAVCTVDHTPAVPDEATFAAAFVVHAAGTCTVRADLDGGWYHVPATKTVSIPVTGSSARPVAPVLEARASVARAVVGGGLVSPGVSTPSGRLLLAHLALGGTSPEGSVSGGGLVWDRVARSVTTTGASEVWAAWVSQPLTDARITATSSVPGGGELTVTSFRGAVAGVGAVGSASGTGAAALSLAPKGTASLVYGSGHSAAVATVTTPIDQRVLHQTVLPSGAFWSQYRFAPTTAGATVPFAVTKPSAGAWQLTATEIPAAP